MQRCVGEQLAEALREGLAENSRIAEVRHLGLLLAVQMNIPCQGWLRKALQQGLLINVTAESVIRLLPPLIISEAETAAIADKLINCINHFTE